MTAPSPLFAGESSEQQAPARSQNQPRTYGENNVDLPEELQNALLRLIQEAQRQDLYQRREEVMRDRQNRFYERGIQHIYETLTGFVLGQPGAIVPQGNGTAQCSEYISDYNIFGRALLIFVSKITENAVGVDFKPDSADSDEDLQAAEAAEAYKFLFDIRNEPAALREGIARIMGVSGRTILWTRTVADAAKWGQDKDGSPKRAQVTTVYGTIETKVPILAKDLSACPYVLITEDPHVYTAKLDHPEFADKISEEGSDGSADNQFERMARIGVLQGNTTSFQMTDTYRFYVERRFAFFRPAMFMDKSLDAEYAEPDEQYRAVHDQQNIDENGQPIPWTLRDALLEAFPEGAQSTFVGMQYVGSRNCCPDDELTIDFPYPGEGMSRRAVMDDAVVIQDDFNDDMNNYHEVKVVGWPSTWIDSQEADLSAINDQVAAPYAFRCLKDQMKQGMEMEHRFFREPNPEIPASFLQHTQYMATELLQYILAIPSAVQGAGMPDQKTKGGYQEAINQAMGQLGIIWKSVKRIMANVYRQAALLASREPQQSSPIAISGPKGTVMLNTSDLSKGRFLAHPDIDSGYPESTIQKRGTLSTIIDLALKDPVIAQALLQSPDNWDFIFRTYGIPELVIPEAKVRRKQLAEIEILLQQQPVMPSPQEVEAAETEHAAATMTNQATGGQPPAPFDPQSLMHSSIQPDPLDYHPWELEECREFLSDWPKVQQQMAMKTCPTCQGEGCPECDGLGQKNNALGIQNVRLHAMEHQKYVAAAEAAQAALMQPSAQPQPIAHPKKSEEQPKQEAS